jgi:hypothetical protein
MRDRPVRNGAIAGYSADAEVLIAPFEAISPEASHQPRKWRHLDLAGVRTDVTGNV